MICPLRSAQVEGNRKFTECAIHHLNYPRMVLFQSQIVEADVLTHTIQFDAYLNHHYSTKFKPVILLFSLSLYHLVFIFCRQGFFFILLFSFFQFNYSLLLPILSDQIRKPKLTTKMASLLKNQIVKHLAKYAFKKNGHVVDLIFNCVFSLSLLDSLKIYLLTH